jgi:UDP-N-acetylglucosamine 2-epimerase (non-hydrolysing)/GDP/UDP-N,N'-diacetylbacillosamine 2-epimerase (hydrolysing)
MARTIAVVTSSRADYGHLYWPLQELRRRPDIALRLHVTGAHLSPEFGLTVSEIERDGFDVAERVECLLSSDTDVAMAKTIGLATIGFADAFARNRPDLLLLIADRYEMMAPATAALAMRLPIAHIEGGEVSEGAIDHAVRNALTMMSHVHLTPTALAAQRVIAMGEEPWRVHQVGAPSLDHLRRSDLPDRAALERQLGIALDPAPIVVAYHPVTLEQDTTVEADAVFGALDRLDEPIVFCFPNADAGSRRLIDRAGAFCAAREHAHLFVNLNHLTYWGLLHAARLLFGNSSSGIMETPSLALPAVNIGLRQEGRERARNIVDVEPDVTAILAGVETAKAPSFRASLDGMTNPYGDGRAGERIAAILADVELGQRLLVKRSVTAPRRDPA